MKTKDKEIIKRPRKTRQTQNKASSDMFTTLCRADLHVECVKEYRFHPTRRWRFDYAIPAYMVALEVEGGVWSGGRHTSPKGFLGDMEKYNTGTAMGWSILRCTPDTLCTTTTLDILRQTINTKKS